ncbi:MAG: hypothetical protein KA765_00925 [Thermoflexales bacterium]|nr:hypothetical protein [Thermoflexales bacterium]
MNPRRFSEKSAQLLLAVLLAVSSLMGIAIPARADTVLPPIPTGTNPIAIAVNPVTNKVYVVNQGSSTVTVIDGATNTAAATVDVATQAAAIAVNPATNKIW